MIDEPVKAFKERWQAVHAFEAEEQRAASIEWRWQQMNALLRLAVGLGLPLLESHDAAEDEAVRRRWAKLKRDLP